MPLPNVVATFNYGARVKHRLRVEVDDNPSDPTTISVYFVDPFGVQTGPFTPTKDAQGYYLYQRTYTASVASLMYGDWDISWRGVGSAEGGIIRRFHINTSRFTS